jgi:hypothetical protein
VRIHKKGEDSHLFSFESSGNCISRCADFAKDIAVIDSRRGGYSLSDQVDAQKMHNACD